MCDSRIFNAAVQLSPDRRAAYLDEACGADQHLRRDVESLLNAHDDPDSFLRSQPRATVEHGAAAEQPGTLIGPYKLLQPIGEGGMGVVYMAEQQTPVRRKVALKVIKPGMDSAQVIARFEAERQALAMMDHQNIAKVLDAGTTASGRPYFVMELVHGVPLTKFCDDYQLTPRQRLGLFIPVCHAVQHAHQKGVIHRDLKPSNILVTMYDDQPVPKVIDFGVAKAVEQRLTEKTLFTQFGTLVGTFEYMSPEQAEPNAFGVDTRSDVYSLGVLLYELLTGTTPLERQRLREAAYGEIVRLIKEEDPPRPSTRLSTSGAALPGISRQRGSAPEQLTKLVRGELDWIVMRCLEKNRTRRYETANGLARDVERYLRDEPVEACPPTAGYRLRKFARTHRRLLATAAGFAALLLLGVAASMWQAMRATQAEAAANEQAEQLRRTSYAAVINLAQRAWDKGDVPRVLKLLDQQRPKPGEADLRQFEWHYLNRLCHSELLTLKGHSGRVNSVAFSPDGKCLAGASGTEVKVRDAQTGQELFSLKLKGHPGAVNDNRLRSSVAFSPDGKRLATWESDVAGQVATVTIWDAQTGQELHTLTTGGGGSVAFSPDGKRLASGSKVWDAQTGQELLNLTNFNHLWFSPDGKRLAGFSRDRATRDGTVKVWDAQTGEELFSFKGGDILAFSPDGTRLASSSGDETVKVRDASTGQELRTLKGHAGYSLAFSPDGRRLANVVNGKEGGAVQVWDTQTGQELHHLKGGHSAGLSTVVFSPDGQRLASTWDDGAVRVWDAQTGQVLRTFYGHTDYVTSAVFSPDGQRLASSSADKTVKVWDAQRDPEALTLNLNAEAFAASPDFGCLASAASDNTVKIWDARTGQMTRTLKGHTAPVRSLAFSSDGKRLASGAGGVRLPDGTFTWTVDPLDRAELKVWDAQTGQELRTFPVSVGAVRSVAFSPDGQRLASATFGPPRSIPSLAMQVWDVQTGQELFTVKRPGGSVTFSPDGKRLASAGGGPRGGPLWIVKVWDAQTGQELLALPGGGGRVAFSPDGKRLASGSKVWDAQSGQELLTLQGGGGVVAFSPDGKRLAGPSGGGVQVWDAQTGEELLFLKGGGHGVAFGPDGHRLASGGTDGTLKIWDATPLPEK
jgi:WD40 repeat protein/serine/threonine protein kinase